MRLAVVLFFHICQLLFVYFLTDISYFNTSPPEPHALDPQYLDAWKESDGDKSWRIAKLIKIFFVTRLTIAPILVLYVE